MNFNAVQQSWFLKMNSNKGSESIQCSESM